MQLIQAFVNGFKKKLKYFLRTIPHIPHLPLSLERTIINKFIPDVTPGYISYDLERVLIFLPAKYGGLAIPIFRETAQIEFMNSTKITSELTTLIKQQSLQYDIHQDNLKKLKSKIKKLREENYKNVTERITTEINDKEKRLLVV